MDTPYSKLLYIDYDVRQTILLNYKDTIICLSLNKNVVTHDAHFIIR